MFDTAQSRVRLVAVALLALPLAACQSTSAGKAQADPAPVSAEPKKSTPEAAVQAASDPAPPKATAVEPVQQAAAQPTAQPNVQPAVNAAPIAGTSSAELVFLDFAGFDEDLSREMVAEREAIAVDVPAAFSLNDVPDRLDRWFYRVKETGGAVKARAKLREGEQQTRGIVGVLLDLAVSAIQAQEAEEMLRPAEDYNVVVEYDKQTGKADRVLFYRR